MNYLVINWLTAANVKSKDIADYFLGLMNRYISNHTPTVFGNIEPLSIPFNDMESIRSSWHKDLHWKGKPGKIKGDFGIEGNVSHGMFWHTWIRHLYDLTLPIEEDVVSFLRDASRLFKVDFSYVHLFGDSEPLPEDKLLQGLVSHDLQKGLPTIPWICCFGEPYITMIGRDRIASAAFWKIEDIDSRMLFCQVTQDASYCLTSEFLLQRELIKSAIGQDYFFDAMYPQKKVIVPKFNFLRTRNS